MNLKERVLNLLGPAGESVSVRELARRLELEPSDRRELKPLLHGLIESGEVVKLRGGRVGRPSQAAPADVGPGRAPRSRGEREKGATPARRGERNLIEGRLACNPAGFGFVTPERALGGATGRRDDVYVSADNLKDALHGDRVVVRVERRTPKGLEGSIVRVLERAMVRVVGRYEADGVQGGHVVPFDKRMLRELSVPPGQAAGAQSGDMVTVEITRPPTATRNPAGRVLEVLGRLSDPGVDLKVVMAKFGLPDAFPEEVEAEAARVPQQVGEAERAGRTDFRPWLTVTIDPESARDHDDAISLDHLPDGGWLLGVHIADVEHYVREGSLLDQEAYLRGTSVYFPDRVVPMLPHALSSRICSLVEGADRLSQTAVITMDPDGRVRGAEFHDGVIRSAARLTYQQAQAIVDGDAGLREHLAALVPMLMRMNELARLLRQRRYARGSLDFDLPEPKLTLDAQGAVTGIVATERLDSMRWIEEFMLAANEAVAARLHEAAAGALFRIHEPPDPVRVQEFCELVATFGYRVPPNLEEIRPEDFQRVLRQIEGKPEERLVSYLLLRTMKLARYHEENLGHFGLATEMYAHFTSPIRRYPDLVVHRALRALRQGRPEAPADPERLPEMGRHLSEMERRAAEAERELIEWKKVRFMADKLGEVYGGYVTGVQAFGLFVELDEVYVQGLVHVSSMSDDFYVFNEKAHTLKGENTRRLYRLGDKVEVQVVRVDLERRQIDFALKDVLERAAAGASQGRPPKAAGRRGSRPPAAGAPRTRRSRR